MKNKAQYKKMNQLYKKKTKNLELLDDEVCGFLRRRTNNRGYYIDRDNEISEEKNKIWFQWYIPIISNKQIEELWINEEYMEGSFVVASISNGKIVELFNEKDWD